MKCLNPEELANFFSARAGIEGTISGVIISQRGFKVEYDTRFKIITANVKSSFRGIRISESNPMG